MGWNFQYQGGFSGCINYASVSTWTTPALIIALTTGGTTFADRFDLGSLSGIDGCYVVDLINYNRLISRLVFTARCTLSTGRALGSLATVRTFGAFWTLGTLWTRGALGGRLIAYGALSALATVCTITPTATATTIASAAITSVATIAATTAAALATITAVAARAV